MTRKKCLDGVEVRWEVDTVLSGLLTTGALFELEGLSDDDLSDWLADWAADEVLGRGWAIRIRNKETVLKWLKTKIEEKQSAENPT